MRRSPPGWNCGPRLRALGAMVPVCVALFFFAPGLRGLFADVYGGLRKHRDLRSLLNHGEEETRITNRICRFRGTEWDTQIQVTRARPEELIDALDAIHSKTGKRADPLSAALSGGLGLLRSAGLPLDALLPAAKPFDFYSSDRHSITRIYGQLVPVQRRPVLIAIATELDVERSALVTMKLRDPAQLQRMLEPPDPSALRRELEEHLPLYPLSRVSDKVENETEDGVYTTYMIEQDGHIAETADFYASSVAGIESFAPDPSEQGGPAARETVFQSLTRGGTRIDIVHMGTDRADKTAAIVKIRRAKSPRHL